MGEVGGEGGSGRLGDFEEDVEDVADEAVGIFDVAYDGVEEVWVAELDPGGLFEPG